jgi:hypothetical protein
VIARDLPQSEGGVQMRIDAVLFVIGLLVALGAAALLFLGIIDSGPAALVGIVGIGLIAAAGGVRAGRSNARS